MGYTLVPTIKEHKSNTAAEEQMSKWLFWASNEMILWKALDRLIRAQLTDKTAHAVHHYNESN